MNEISTPENKTKKDAEMTPSRTTIEFLRNFARVYVNLDSRIDPALSGMILN